MFVMSRIEINTKLIFDLYKEIERELWCVCV